MDQGGHIQQVGTFWQDIGQDNGQNSRPKEKENKVKDYIKKLKQEERERNAKKLLEKVDQAGVPMILDHKNKMAILDEEKLVFDENRRKDVLDQS